MWSPQRFWRATVPEVVMAFAGWNRAQSGGTQPMTREEFNELKREYGSPAKSIRKPKSPDTPSPSVRKKKNA